MFPFNQQVGSPATLPSMSMREATSGLFAGILSLVAPDGSLQVANDMTFRVPAAGAMEAQG